MNTPNLEAIACSNLAADFSQFGGERLAFGGIVLKDRSDISFECHDTGNTVIYYAMAGREPVGRIIGVPNVRRTKWYEVKSIFVAPRYRRLGVGTALLYAVITQGYRILSETEMGEEQHLFYRAFSKERVFPHGGGYKVV